MKTPPAVVVRGLADARAALAPGLPVTLLSVPGAALFAGCGWWQALAAATRAEHPGIAVCDILDCADAPGQALAALRIGQRGLVLEPCSGRTDVEQAALGCGAILLPRRPPALDLARRAAPAILVAWLAGDSPAPLL